MHLGCLVFMGMIFSLSSKGNYRGLAFHIINRVLLATYTVPILHLVTYMYPLGQESKIEYMISLHNKSLALSGC